MAEECTGDSLCATEGSFSEYVRAHTETTLNSVRETGSLSVEGAPQGLGTHLENTPRGNTTALSLERYTSYTLGKLLGMGSFGTCFIATNTATGERVACKFLPHFMDGFGCRIEEIRREARIHATLNHEHVVRFRGMLERPGATRILLELCAEKTLQGLVDDTKGAGLPETRVRQLVREITNGVVYLHDNRVMHHDLKPSNILLDAEQRAKIADFGLSVLLEEGESHRCCDGTTLYMAPEMLRLDETHAFKADVWAVGCIAFELLAGRSPFYAEKWRDIHELVSANKYTMPQGITEEAEAFIAGTLVRDPGSRPDMRSVRVSSAFFTTRRTQTL